MASTSLNQTTLTAAITAKTQIIPLAAVTGIAVGSFDAGTVGTQLWVVDPGQQMGEAMNVLSVTGLNVTVSRFPGAAVAHVSGAMVLAGPPNAFHKYDPTGATDDAYTPWLNTMNGKQWLFSSVTGCWVAGFHNSATPSQATVTVASAAAAILPSGPYFTVSGTSAVTGFTVPVGGLFASFSITPSGVFTWTTAGNIGLAGTAVVGKVLTFTWDFTSSKYLPSYIA